MGLEIMIHTKDYKLICAPSVRSVGQEECKGSGQVTITSTN